MRSEAEPCAAASAAKGSAGEGRPIERAGVIGGRGAAGFGLGGLRRACRVRDGCGVVVYRRRIP